MALITGMIGPCISVLAGEFNIRMFFMNQAANSLSPSITITSITKCQGIMLQEYVNFAHEIEKSLKKYKELLLKDFSDIEESERLFELMDHNLSDFLKKGVFNAGSAVGKSGSSGHHRFLSGGGFSGGGASGTW